MANHQSRAEFLAANPHARAWAALDEATNQQKKITPRAIKLRKGSFKGKRAIILGSGVAGLTTAYELLAHKTGMKVTILEAHSRTGGRCLSLRTGDTLTEDRDNKLFGSKPGETQTVRFKRPVGDAEPYLNAGPGRIPSSHKRLLSYLERFGVAVEVYVMNTESNLVQMEGGPFKGAPVVYRRLNHNTRGWLAQMVYEKAETLLRSCGVDIDEDDLCERVEQLKSLMVAFGELTKNGKYAPTAGEDGFENARSRAGFDVLPGVDAGKIAKAIGLDKLLDSEFWKKTRFFQPVDFLWQPTLFQPVGGMDRVQHAFAQQVAALGADIHLNSPVKKISYENGEFVIHVSQVGTKKCVEYRADYCFSNIAMPFLKKILSKKLQGRGKGGLTRKFKKSLRAVYDAQFKPGEGFVQRFLANTTKVGWQGDRSLWQGSPIKNRHCPDCDEDLMVVPKSEVGVVPIYGGISWTDDEITQIWYPSNDYHDKKGVLTGTYNFAQTAYCWGRLPVKRRLKKARRGARKFGKKFANGLHDGVAIAWQNMPYIKGGWAQWQAFDNPRKAVRAFNILAQGSSVDGGKHPVFFVVGDQLSSLPGWQEGAIASALNAICRLARPDMAIPYLETLPDTRLMVEGI